MELLRGRASHVASFNAPGTVSSEDVFDAAIQRHCTFALGNREIRIAAFKPPVIRNGDDVVVVGETDRTGVLSALGYVNVTRGVGDVKWAPWPWKTAGVLTMLVGLLAMLAIGVLALTSLIEPLESGGERTVIIALVFLVLFDFVGGLWLWRRGKKYALAIKMIRDASVKAAARAG